MIILEEANNATSVRSLVRPQASVQSDLATPTCHAQRRTFNSGRRARHYGPMSLWKNQKAGQLVRPLVIRFKRLHQDVQKCGGPTQSLFGPRHEQNLSANPETNSEIDR